MSFLARVNRKLIAGIFFSIFYLDVYAHLEVSKNGIGASSRETYNERVNYPIAFHKEPGVNPNKKRKNKPLKVEKKSTVSKFGKRNGIDIEGPGQPEMKTFKPTGLNDMVDLFTGDFSYNIPLLDVGGYPVNLFYSGGISMEQEASWVGLGWNINPGTVSRNMRGLPDDFKGDIVTKQFNIKNDITVGVNITKAFEIFGKPKNKKFNAEAKGSVGIFYNNYRGVGLEAGLDPSFSISNKNATEQTKGMQDTTSALKLTGGLKINLNSQSGMSLSPYINFSKTEKLAKAGIGATLNYNSRSGLQNLQLHTEARDYSNPTQRFFSELTPMASTISFAKTSVTPTVRIPMNSFNANLSLRVSKKYKRGVLVNAPTIMGYLAESHPQTNEKQSKAYGYFNYSDAGDKDALLDFNRIHDIPYVESNRILSFPVYTYDIFSISGEGTGGSFRGYRADIGFIKDQYIKSRSSSFSLGLGFDKQPDGEPFKIDINANPVISTTEIGTWLNNNLAKDVLQFTSDKGLYQSVYFKNPAEKTIIDRAYFEALGGDDMVRLQMVKHYTEAMLKPAMEVYNPLSGYYKGLAPLNNSITRRVRRDKRSQVITVLNAREASIAGLNKKIEYYPVNVFPKGDCDPGKKVINRWEVEKGLDPTSRKEYHISEVTVLGGEGRRYVYGVPVYNYKQVDATFNINGKDPGSIDAATGLVSYGNEENSIDNSKGNDHFFQKEIIPAYAHSFLLSGLLSPDYVDLKGDGITEDDLGNAVKFNYSKMFFAGRDYIKWRAPFTSLQNKASYSPGLLTDNSDDKGNYSYGEKELWYLNSVESKTMIATFVISATRNDGKEALDENGGVNLSSGTYRLDTIHLYSKAEFYKNGRGARPIKSVIFEYAAQADELCKGVENAATGHGKLTLKRVWFGYSGIYKKKNNKPINGYSFKYNNNVSYDRNGNDRWGNYKNETYNPGDLSNANYPWVDQTTHADEIAPWQLNEITLPAGGKIKVTYEQDDYAYVQNRRAAAMMKIAGFGHGADGVFNNELYTSILATDNFYVYVKALQPLPANVAEANKLIKDLYIGDLTQLYLKLSVKVPSDQFGGGHELIGLYADIKEWGPAPGGEYFYIKIDGYKDKISQVADGVIQYAKDNLTSKLYPGFNTRDQSAVQALAKSLLGMGTEIINVVGGFDNVVRVEKKLQLINTEQSFVRLSHPGFKKLGGGYRVKEVRISDEWDVMTQQFKSEYGQVYDYTTSISVNGVEKIISSGVASYEPSIGNEENPFREVMRSRIRKTLAKDQFLMQELPVGEMFYPAAMVGYSKVRITSIKKGNVKNGTTVQEMNYFTTKDFPTISSFTTFDANGKIRYRPDPFSRIMTHRSSRTDNLSQGLLVSLNDMNGKMKSQATFAENDLKNAVTYTEHFYRTEKISERESKLNNLVSVIKDPNGKIYENEIIGKDMELMMDFREHYTKTRTMAVDFNLEGLRITPWPILIPILLRGIYSDENLYRASSVVKVVNTYGILESIKVIDKGSEVSTKNLVYDGETGDVLLSQTINEFEKPLYNFSYPAYWAYKGMAGAYRNIQAVYKGIHFREGKITKGDINIDDLESGDELMIVKQPFFNAPLQSEACRIMDGFSPIAGNREQIIWAIDTRKDPLNPPAEKDMVFVNRKGDLFNGIADVKIIRSGFRNILAASVGSIVSLNNPIQDISISGEKIIAFDNSTSVINAGVQEFRELWRTDDLLEVKDSLQTLYNDGTTNNYTFYPQNTYSLQLENKSTWNIFGDGIVWKSSIEQAFYAKAESREIKALFSLGVRYYRTKSWQQYDLSSLPANSFVKSAKVTLGISAANWPHVSRMNLTNRFYLIRTRHPWYASGTEGWKNNFINTTTDLTSENGVIHAPLPSSGVGSSNENVYNHNVTSPVRSMVRDLPLGYTSAFKISLSDDIRDKNQAENKVRFMPHTEANCVQNLLETRECSHLDVECLTCPPGYTVKSVGFSFKTGNIYKCVKTELTKYCESLFNRNWINPYTTGLLGNWRLFRSLVYYDKRVEASTLDNVELNKGGVIANFKPYWELNIAGLTTVYPEEWVWNSQVTQINTKGAELENKDALLRYNAGVYGYNDNLPIAIANNARYQEIAFDGFEDYDFHTQDCEPFCKKERRIKFDNGSVFTPDNTVSHTGLSSLKINANSLVSLDGIVKPVNQADDHSVRIQMNRAQVQITRVNGKGNGFRGTYYSHSDFIVGPMAQIDPKIEFAWPKKSDVPNNAESIRWEGSLQAFAAGNYKLRIGVTNCALRVWAGGIKLLDAEIRGNVEIPIGNLDPNLLKSLKIEYVPYYSRGWWSTIKVEWKRVEDNGGYTSIPTSLVYSPGNESLAANTVTTETAWCIKSEKIGGTGNYLVDGFNLVQGKKMIVNAWVKEGNQDCKCSTYVNNQVMVYCNGVAQTAALKPAGSIIEGWQRVEGEFTVPVDATSYSIKFQNTGNGLVYYDDIRVHPFNSNMKSFVYHPDNLRLMAELDENNYATFYEYDAEGTMIRLKKETEKGVKTIKESRSANQKIITE